MRHRGLENAKQAANLNTLLRALATYAAGPYIRTNILENTNSLHDVKKEFMKYLEIDLTDLTALEWFDIRRRPTERPLVFYMRLKYHMSKAWTPQEVKALDCAMINELKIGITYMDQAEIPNPNNLPLEA